MELKIFGFVTGLQYFLIHLLESSSIKLRRFWGFLVNMPFIRVLADLETERHSFEVKEGRSKSNFLHMSKLF